MRQQRRKIKTPCCNEWLSITWPRGWHKAHFHCPYCEKRFIINFSIDESTGKSHKVISKECME